MERRNVAALRHLTILLLLAPVASFLSPTLLRAGGALLAVGAPGLAHQRLALSPASGWPRQTSTCRSLRAQMSEMAPFGEGLRVLSLREQRELLEFLQNAQDPATPFTDSAPYLLYTLLDTLLESRTLVRILKS